jgi:hypothetical protein
VKIFLKNIFFSKIVLKHLAISHLQRPIPLKSIPRQAVPEFGRLEMESKTSAWQAKDEGATVTPLTQMLNSTGKRMRKYIIFRCLTFRLK